MSTQSTASGLWETISSALGTAFSVIAMIYRWKRRVERRIEKMERLARRIAQDMRTVRETLEVSRVERREH